MFAFYDMEPIPPNLPFTPEILHSKISIRKKYNSAVDPACLVDCIPSGIWLQKGYMLF